MVAVGVSANPPPTGCFRYSRQAGQPLQPEANTGGAATPRGPSSQPGNRNAGNEQEGQRGAKLTEGHYGIRAPWEKGRRRCCVSLRPQGRGSPLEQFLIPKERRDERTKGPRVRLLYLLSLPDWLAFVRDQPIPLLLFSPLRSQCSFAIFLFLFLISRVHSPSAW